MENFILIAIALVVLLLIIRFVFKATKTVITIAVAIVLLGVGMHYFAPEKLDKFLGKERHDKIVKLVETNVNTVADTVKKKIDEVGI